MSPGRRSASMYSVLRGTRASIGPLSGSRSPAAETVLPDGARLQLFEISPDGRRWSSPRCSRGTRSLWVRPSTRLEDSRYQEQKRPDPSGHPTVGLSAFVADGKLKSRRPSAVVHRSHCRDTRRTDRILAGRGVPTAASIVFAEGAGGPLRRSQRWRTDGGGASWCHTPETGVIVPGNSSRRGAFLFSSTRRGANVAWLGSLDSRRAGRAARSPPTPMGEYVASGYLLLVRQRDADGPALRTRRTTVHRQPAGCRRERHHRRSLAAWSVFRSQRPACLDTAVIWRSTSHLTWFDRSGTVLEVDR